jgi:hypothetical protein
MAGPRPEDFGLSERLIDEIRARERKQGELFVYLLVRGVALAFVVLAFWIYTRSFGRAPLAGLLVAPLLGALGAAIAGLPIAVLSALFSWFLHPRHPLAQALERYEAATAGIRVCDVCRLARGDETPREGVAYCGRCGAYLCPDCRQRYDLRAIAALKRAAQRPSRPPGAPRATDST